MDQNLGFCGGCNVGIRRALDEGAGFIMLLNNDTIVPPDLIVKLVEASGRLESVGALSL
ncbi:MAG: glycosyltransferase family 2 protein [Acidobacteria bacterium]|nr:glycosyltransferase family 2 protein [Acidobacteriota bacterium]